MDERVFKFWKRVGSNLTLRQLVQKYWTDAKSRAEFAVDLGVMKNEESQVDLPSLSSITPRFSLEGHDFVPSRIKKKNRRGINGQSLDISHNRYRSNLGLDGNKEDIFLE